MVEGVGKWLINGSKGILMKFTIELEETRKRSPFLPPGANDDLGVIKGRLFSDRLKAVRVEYLEVDNCYILTLDTPASAVREHVRRYVVHALFEDYQQWLEKNKE